MKRTRTATAVFAAVALNAAIFTGNTLVPASAAPAAAPAASTTKSRVSVAPTAATKKLAATRAYGDAQARLLAAKRKKANAKTIAVLQTRVNAARYAYGASIAALGINKQVLSKPEVDAVGAWARYLARGAKANPKSAIAARQARHAATYAKQAVAQYTTKAPSKTPTKAPSAVTGTTPKAPTAAPAPVAVSKYVLPKITYLSATCTRISSTEYEYTWRTKATGGKYTDRGDGVIGANTHIDGGTYIWDNGPLSIFAGEMTDTLTTLTRRLFPNRTIADYGIDKNSRNGVWLATVPSVGAKKPITCPTPSTSKVGDSLTTTY